MKSKKILEINTNDKEDSNLIELTLLHDVYKVENKIDPETNLEYEDHKLIKKNARVKKLVYKDEINSIEEEINASGTCYKNRVKVSIRGLEPVTVLGNYSKLKQQIFNPTIKPVGFKFY